MSKQINKLWEQIDSYRVEGVKSVVVKSSRQVKEKKNNNVKLKSPRPTELTEIQNNKVSHNKINVRILKNILIII